MNLCDDFRNDLDAYRDKALDRQRTEQISTHLQHCSDCRKQLDHDAMIEAELKSLASTWVVSENLWSRIKTSVSNESRAAGSSPSHRRWVAAAMFLFAFGFMVYLLPGLNHETQSNSVARALVSEFHTFVISKRTLDYTHDQPNEIRRWFSSKVDFRVPLPIKASEMDLSGGRLCNMFEQRVVSYMYRYEDAWVSLYIKKLSNDVSEQVMGSELALSGYGYIDWQDQGLHYSLVGDIPSSKLRSIAIELGASNFIEA